MIEPHIYKFNTQTRRRKMSPKIVWLEQEDFEEAQLISEDNVGIGDISQWRIYLNALALIGLEKCLKERNPNIKINTDSSNHAIYDACYLRVDEFRFCLITIDNLIDDFVSVPEKLIFSAKMSAHFYILIEVLEEDEQLSIHGFLRYDELLKYSQTLDIKSQPDGSYQLPLFLFDSDLNSLLIYTRFLSPSAIKLPIAETDHITVIETLNKTTTQVGKKLVNLSKWWDRVFEEGWQSTESIWSTIPNNLTWGYARSRKESNMFSVSQSKLYDFGLRLQNQKLALIIYLEKEENEEQGVLIQVIPHQKENLPSGLKLKITLNSNTSDSINQEVAAREADNTIQLEFSVAPGEQFKVEVSYQNAVITEEFVLETIS